MIKYRDLASKLKKDWMFFIPFISFTVLLRFSPMMYDGWAGAHYYNNQGGIIKWFIYMFSYYKWINGRVASTFFSGILESFRSEIFLDLANAIVMTMICWVLIIIFKVTFIKKKILIVILYFSLIFFMPFYMRNYVIQIATFAFIPPILFSLIFYLFSENYIIKTKNPPKSIIWTLLVLSFCICTWIEHIALGFGLTLGVTLLYLSLRDKRYYRYLWLFTIISFLSGLLMFLAPSLKQNRTVISGGTNLSIVFFENIKSLYQFLFYDNIPILIIFFLLFSCLLYQKRFVSNRINILLFTIFTLAGILLFIVWFNGYIFNNQTIHDLFNQFYFGVVNNKFLSISVFCFSIILILIGFSSTKVSKKFILLVMFAIFSLLPISFTPNLSPRVASIGFFIQLFLCIGILSEIDFNNNGRLQKIIIITLFILGILAIDQQILLCRRIYTTSKNREMIIYEAVIKQKMEKWDFNKDILRLPVYKFGDIRDRGVVNEESFHYPLFLSYYDLASKTKVIFTNSDYYYVNVDKSGSYVTFQIESSIKIEENQKFYYKFSDKYENEIFNSIQSVEKIWTFKCPVGQYTVYPYITQMNEDGSILTSLQLIDQPISLKCP